MTQTSNAKKIQFRIVKGAGRRVNHETGVEIRVQRLHGVKNNRYEVAVPTRDGFDIKHDELDLTDALEFAAMQVELMRCDIEWARREADELTVPTVPVPAASPASTKREPFRGVEGGGRYVNIETGVEILRSSFGGWMVVIPGRNAEIIEVKLDMIRSAAVAKLVAVPVVEARRAELALAHDAATAELAGTVTAGLVRAHDDLAASDEPNRAISALLFGARHSLNSGYVTVAYERLTRAVAMLADRSLVPSDADAAAELAAVNEAMPIGTMVVVRGKIARVHAALYIVAETNRVAVPVRFVGKGYTSTYATDVTPA
jgi:hypothetical protein